MAVGAKFLEGAAYGVLNDVLSSFHANEGYASPNRYEVLIHGPTGVQNYDGFDNWSLSGATNVLGSSVKTVSSRELQDISLRCETVALPGRNLSTSPDSNVYGPLRTVVDGINYADEINMVFQASGDMAERVFFEKWQYAAFNQQTWNLGYYNDYIGFVEIYLLDRQEQRQYGLKLWECFPKSINQTELNYGTQNEIIKLSVAMNFRYWTSLDINQDPSSLGDKIAQTLRDTVVRNVTRSVPAVLRSLVKF